MKGSSIKRGQILFVFWVTLSIWGILNLYSASSIEQMQNGYSAYSLAIENLILFGIGLLIYLFTSRKYTVPYNLVRKNAFLINLIIFISLVLVLFVGVDKDENLGASSVFNLKVFMYQPMEFYKISMILFFAHHFSKLSVPNKFEHFYRGMGFCLLGIFLVFVEPDAGGALILLMTLFLLFLVNGDYILIALKYAIPAVITGVVSLFILIQTGILQAYQVSRITNWINPFKDDQGDGLQLVQSFIAIANGGVAGSGFMTSVQKTSFLPFPSSDAIMAIMLEEWGIFALIFTVLLIFGIAITCFSIGFNSEDRFDELYSYGIGCLFLSQTFINIGGITGTIPLTGVTLPLISYGKNSYITLMLGLLFVIVIDRVNEKRKREERAKSDSFFM